MDEVAAAVPAPVEEPRAWRLERTRSWGSIEDLHPPLEPEPRRERVDQADVVDAVLQMVRQQIHEGPSHLDGARELARVESVAPDVTALSAEQLVHAHREANDEAPHAAREAGIRGPIASLVGLDDGVDVIGLDREVGHAERSSPHA